MNPAVANTLLAVATCWGASALCTAGSLPAGLLGLGESDAPAGRPMWSRVLDRLGFWLLAVGSAILAGLLTWMWIELDRPPLRTLGETRLWYAALLPAIAVAMELRLRTTSLRLPMLFFGVLFVTINLMKPEVFDRTLMPALQSPWFVPHVIVYMVAYAALGLSCGAAVWTLVVHLVARRPLTVESTRLPLLLVHLGIPFLTLGLVFGALWAKEAWGHYWTWDPKETWAFLSWAAYVGIVHYERLRERSPRATLLLVAGAFVAVLACWFLVNLLPAAASSVHTYTQT